MTAAKRKNAQRNRDTVFVESGELLGTEEFPSQQYIMRIRASKCAVAAKPGSFVHISCDDELPMRRPMSIMRATYIDNAPTTGITVNQVVEEE